jgi:hypothetical protein
LGEPINDNYDDFLREAREVPYLPAPWRIRREAALIRRGWSPSEVRRRAAWAFVGEHVEVQPIEAPTGIEDSERW